MGNRQSDRAVQEDNEALSSKEDEERKKKLFSAAIFMKEGKHHIPFKYHPMSKNEVTAFSYAHGRLVNSIDLVAGLVLLALAFFEDPAVYPLPVAVSAVIEILMLLLLLVHSAVSFVWKGPRFFEEKKIIMKHVLIVEMLVEAFVVLARQQHHMRIMRAFRPLLFLSSKYTKKIKRVMYAMLKSFIPAVDVLILLFTFVTLFAVFGFYLFSEESQTDQYTDDLKNWYFEDFAGSWINLFILTTTANHPDVVMPANKKYFWAPLFFMLFTLICNYLLNGLLLAVVFNNFKDIDKKRSCRDYRYRRRGLRWAFREVSPNDNYREDLMDFETFKRIMEAYKPCLKKDTQTVLAMFYALSKKVKDRLTLEEWLDLPTIWHCSSWKKSAKSDSGFCCGTDRCEGKWLEGLRKFVDSPRLECFICFVIVVNAAFIIAETVIRTSKNISNDLLDGYEEAFLAIYTIELALKITSYGPRRYWKSVFNQFDFAVVAVGLVGQIVDEELAFTAILRHLRLLRLLRLKRSFLYTLQSLAKILPQMVRFIVTLVCVYYFFAIIGMEFFSGLLSKCGCVLRNNSGSIQCQPELFQNQTAFTFVVDNTDYGDCGPSIHNCTMVLCESVPDCSVLRCGRYYGSYYDRSTADGLYYLNNFDSLRHSYVTLFTLMVINNWHVTMQGTVDALRYLRPSGYEELARAYFIVFYLVTVIIVLHVVTSFIISVIEIFMLHPTLIDADIKDKHQFCCKKQGEDKKEGENKREFGTEEVHTCTCLMKWRKLLCPTTGFEQDLEGKKEDENQTNKLKVEAMINKETYDRQMSMTKDKEGRCVRCMRKLRRLPLPCLRHGHEENNKQEDDEEDQTQTTHGNEIDTELLEEGTVTKSEETRQCEDIKSTQLHLEGTREIDDLVLCEILFSEELQKWKEWEERGAEKKETEEALKKKADRSGEIAETEI